MIRIAIIGVGNCACSLLQAIEADKIGKLTTGIVSKKIANYEIKDIEVVAAFDVDSQKVGKVLSEAAFAHPNCTTKYFNITSEVIVQAGPLLDGLSETLLKEILIDKRCSEEISIQELSSLLNKKQVDVVISYLPVGAQKASEYYAKVAAHAGCSFINCTPAIIANNPQFVDLFESKNLPLLGDDIKSQVGSTTFHQLLLKLLDQKGIKINNTYQLNIGGNNDFKNMKDLHRGMHKKKTKELALKGFANQEFSAGVGPSDYIPHLQDFKEGFINISGQGLLGMPFNLEMHIRVEDSPNSAGVAVDAIREAKASLDRKEGGVILNVCPRFFKFPPEQILSEALFR